MRRRGWLSANRALEVPPKCHVRKGDTVVVIAGKDRGKSGKVLSVFRLDRQVTVEKINIIKRHTKPTQQNRQGGILEREAPIHRSEEHTSELQSQFQLVCRLLLEKKK